MIGSIALMFDRCLGLTDEADEIWNALFAVFERGYVTADLAQDVHERTEIITTEAFGDMVVQHILKSS